MFRITISAHRYRQYTTCMHAQESQFPMPNILGRTKLDQKRKPTTNNLSFLKKKWKTQDSMPCILLKKKYTHYSKNTVCLVKKKVC